MCICVAMASMVPTPLLKPREYGLIGWADHLTLASTKTFKIMLCRYIYMIRSYIELAKLYQFPTDIVTF